MRIEFKDRIKFRFALNNRLVTASLILVTLLSACHLFNDTVHAEQPQFYRPIAVPKSAYRYESDLDTTNWLKGEILMMCIRSGITMEKLTWFFGEPTYWTRGGSTSIMFMQYGIALEAKPIQPTGQLEYTKISGGIGP